MKKKNVSELTKATENEMYNFVCGKSYNDKIIIDWCRMVTNSVLRKLIGVSNDNKCIEMKKDIAEQSCFENAMDMLNNADIVLYEYNSDGDRVFTNDYLEYTKNIDSLVLNNNFGDGVDLVNDCFIKLVDECIMQYESCGYINLTEQYTDVKQKKLVVIRDNDNKGLYKEVETTILQECFRYVRECIRKSGSFTTASNKYTYIESELENGDIVYKRLNGVDVGQIAYQETFSHATTVSAIDDSAMDKINSIIDLLELSDQQKKIVRYRLRGYGYKAIATALGVKSDNVKTQCKRIKAKAEKIGLSWDNSNESDSKYTFGKSNKNLLSDTEKSEHIRINKRVAEITKKYAMMNI